MAKEVLDIHSRQPVYHEGHPNPSVIENCEKLLERAKSGEIVGLAWAALSIDLTTGEGWSGDTSRGIVGALFSVATRITIK